MPTTEHSCRGCEEYQEWTRRRFLGGARAALASVISTPAWLPRVVLAEDHSDRDCLVIVFLRGGMDGLTTVPPHGDPNYYSPTLRPRLAVPRGS